MRILSLIVLVSFFSMQVNAQVDSTTKAATTTVALLYNSNISYYGQVTSEKYPYVLLNATYRLPIGLSFSAGGYKLLNYVTGLSETDLGIGYDYEFNEVWSAGIAYSRSFFPKNSPLLAASNPNNINLSTSYEKWLKASLSTDYAFGKQKDFFVTLGVAKNVELGTFLSDKNLISIEPALEAVAGTRQFYETYLVEKEKRNNGKGKGAVNAPGQSIATTTEISRNSFELLSYNFKLPISLSRAHYMAEASYQFSILGAGAGADLRSQTSVFGLAFYYQF